MELRYNTRAEKQLQEIRTRNEGGDPIIEGYFVVFDGTYNIADGVTESVDRDAFNETIGGDIRILVDHDTRLVLGRTGAGTAQVRVDERGVWGHVDINPNDSDAVNAHARVERGDVTQGSFGFDILEEETEYREDGSVHFTIKKVELYELSVVTFPAYEETSISARKKQADEIKARTIDAWKAKAMTRLKGEEKNA